jgi:hypothetical protein
VNVVTVAVVEVDPAGIVTETGTVATPVFWLVRLITTPPAGAGAARVTVRVELVPPGTEVGLSATLTRTGRLTETVVVLLVVTRAVIVAVRLEVPTEVTGKIIVETPCGTVTVAGTVTCDVLEVS